MMLATETVKIDWEFHRRQSMAMAILDEMRNSPELDELMYGGAKGGGKSVEGVRWMYLMAKWVIKKFKLEPREKPIPVGFMGRLQWSDFRTTTLETWFEQIPSELYIWKEQKKELIIDHTVKIVCGGFDHRDDIRKFNSAEYGFAFIDQAEEIPQDDIGSLTATMRRKINGVDLPFVVLYTANPAQCWIKEMFIDTPDTKHKRFIQSLPSDNRFLPKSYINTLKKSFRHRPELLEAYLYGSWDAMEVADIIIRDIWIKEAKTRKFIEGGLRRVIVCDPARYGDDETVIHYMENTKRVEEKIYGKKDLYYTANTIAVMANQHKNKDGKVPLIVIDGDGLGAGVIDILRQLKFKVYELKSAAKAMDSDRFGNVRAEMWWNAGVMYADGDIEDDELPDDMELNRQLNTTKYRIVKGRIYAEEKDEIKKRLKRSPDRADTRVMGLYSLKFAPLETTKKRDAYGKKKKKDLGAMAA